MGLGSTLGGIVGGAGGFLLGGPAGAIGGYALGSGIGGYAESALGGGGSSGGPSLQGDPLMDKELADNATINANSTVPMLPTTPQGYYAEGAPRLNLAGSSPETVENNIFHAATQVSGTAAPTIAAPNLDYSVANAADNRFQGTTAQQLGLNQLALSRPYEGEQADLVNRSVDQPYATGLIQTANDLASGPNAAAQLQLANRAAAASPYAIPQQQAARTLTTGDQVVGQQQQLADYLKGQAMGTNGPSAAQAQLQAGADTANRAAASMAASAGPRDYALARRAAIDAAANNTQQAGTQAAILRAQEQQSAQGQLGNVLQTQRGQTQQGAQSAASINANLEQQRQAGIGQAAGITAGVEGQRVAGLTAAANVAGNVENQRQAGIATAGNITQQAAQNYQAGVGQAMGNTNSVAGNQLNATGQAIGVTQANAQLQLQQQQAQAQTDLQNRQLNQGFYLDATGQAINLGTNQQNQLQNYMLQREANSNQRMGIANNLAIGSAQVGVAQQQNQNQMTGALLGAAGAALPYLAASDVRLKSDVRPAADDELEEVGLKLRPVHYKYRDEAYGEGPVTGILAQDLERSRLGRQVVVDTPAGKMLDLRKTTSLVLAQNASLTRRVKQLEMKGGA